MDLFKDLLSQIKALDTRLKRIESSNQVQSITNSDGTVIFDPTGLVSTANFPSAQLFNGLTTQTTSSTSFVDVTGSSLASVVLTRPTRFMVFFMAYGYNDTAITSNLANSAELIVYDSFDNAEHANIIFSGINATNITGGGTIITETDGDEMVNQTTILTFDAGTHGFKLQFRAKNGGTAHLDSWLIGYAILGT